MSLRRVAVGGASLLAVGFVLLQTSVYGARVTPDSVEYVAAAQSYAAGGPLVRYSGEPLVHWAPLFPVVLSVRASSLTEAASTARWLNALCMGAIVGLAGTWLHGLLSRRWLAVAGTVLVACAFPLFHVAGSVWSEPLFILLCLLSLRAVQAARRRGGWGEVLAAGACAGLAGLTRYAGVLVAVAGVLALLVPPRALTRRRVGQAAAFLALATAPVAWWLVITSRSTGGPPGGTRAGSTASLPGLVTTLLDGIAAWVVPRPAPAALRMAAIAGAVALVVVLIARARSDAGAGGRYRARLAAVVPLGLFVAVYAAGIVGAAYFTSLNPPEGRLLSPIVVPAILVGFAVLDAALSTSGRMATPALRAGVGGLVLSQALLAALLVVPGIQRRATVFEGPDWTISRLMAHLDAPAIGPDAYTNAPWAVYYQTGRVFRPLTRVDRDADDVSKHLAGGRAVTVVWFDNPSVASLASLREKFLVDPMLLVDDGGVYRISARPTP